ncbi:hypothetical protein HPULCUR_006159 [Helicostylum pulchrum]|uniref:Uncharacterized protein n=1 Tax=Helicostylum pulchrum TaxID=562976 RepID=A0ABP9Y2C4_9FUNG
MTGFVLVANGHEVGCGEIKPPGTSFRLLEEDRARSAEILKQQLYVRMLKSKNPKEFVTFGYDIELYIMVFDFENSCRYQFYEIEASRFARTLHKYRRRNVFILTHSC